MNTAMSGGSISEAQCHTIYPSLHTKLYSNLFYMPCIHWAYRYHIVSLHILVLYACIECTTRQHLRIFQCEMREREYTRTRPNTISDDALGSSLPSPSPLSVCVCVCGARVYTLLLRRPCINVWPSAKLQPAKIFGYPVASHLLVHQSITYYTIQFDSVRSPFEFLALILSLRGASWLLIEHTHTSM